MENNPTEIDLSGLNPKPKKKISTAFFILIMLIGFMCVAGAGLYIETKHNKCVVDLHECSKQCMLIPQKDLQDGGLNYEIVRS